MQIVVWLLGLGWKVQKSKEVLAVSTENCFKGCIVIEEYQVILATLH